MILEGYKVYPQTRTLRPLEVMNYQFDNIKTPNGLNNSAVIFSSLSEMVACIGLNSKEYGNGSWNNRGYEHGDDMTWIYGTEYPGFKKTSKALLHGQVSEATLSQYQIIKDEIFDKYPELLDLKHSALKIRKRRKFSEEGAELDIDRYMCGDPEQWETRIQVKDKKVLKIMFNGCLSARNDPKVFIENIILCTIFIDIVKSLNVSVEFWYGMFSKNSTSDSAVSTVLALVKGADEEVDIQRILSCGIPGLFRFYVLRLLSNVMRGLPSDGLGSPLNEVPDWVLQIYDIDVCVSASQTSTDLVNTLVDNVKSLINNQSYE